MVFNLLQSCCGFLPAYDTFDILRVNKDAIVLVYRIARALCRILTALGVRDIHQYCPSDDEDDGNSDEEGDEEAEDVDSVNDDDENDHEGSEPNDVNAAEQEGNGHEYATLDEADDRGLNRDGEAGAGQTADDDGNDGEEDGESATEAAMAGADENPGKCGDGDQEQCNDDSKDKTNGQGAVIEQDDCALDGGLTPSAKGNGGEDDVGLEGEERGIIDAMDIRTDETQAVADFVDLLLSEKDKYLALQLKQATCKIDEATYYSEHIGAENEVTKKFRHIPIGQDVQDDED